MTDDRMALLELVEKAADADLVHEMLLEPVAQQRWSPKSGHGATLDP